MAKPSCFDRASVRIAPQWRCGCLPLEARDTCMRASPPRLLPEYSMRNRKKLLPSCSSQHCGNRPRATVVKPATSLRRESRGRSVGMRASSSRNLQTVTTFVMKYGMQSDTKRRKSNPWPNGPDGCWLLVPLNGEPTRMLLTHPLGTACQRRKRTPCLLVERTCPAK